MFRSRALRYQGDECLRFKKDGFYQSISWSELNEKILQLAGFLLSQTLQKGDRIALLSENRPEWALTDLAILSIGCITVPIYPTLSPKEAELLLEDSGAKLLLVSRRSLAGDFIRWKGTILVFEEPSFVKALAEGEAYR